MSEPRHSSIMGKSAAVAALSAENARDTIEALRQHVRSRIVTIERWAATGDPLTRIPIETVPGVRPEAVLLVRIYKTADPSANISALPRFNFYHDDIGAGVYEPSGLETDAQYNMTFLVLE